MKTTGKLTIVLFVTAAVGGCASSAYLINRRSDAADILTLTIGMAFGGRARVGPLHAGVIRGIGSEGLRGGEGVAEGICGGSGEVECLVIPFPSETELASAWCFGEEAFQPGSPRGKGYVAASRIPFVTTDFGPEKDRALPAFPAYWTQVEAQMGVILGPRIGMNPGEILDFVVGWTTIGMFGDDLCRACQQEHVVVVDG